MSRVRFAAVYGWTYSRGHLSENLEYNITRSHVSWQSDSATIGISIRQTNRTLQLGHFAPICTFLVEHMVVRTPLAKKMHAAFCIYTHVHVYVMRHLTAYDLITTPIIIARNCYGNLSSRAYGAIDNSSWTANLLWLYVN